MKIIATGTGLLLFASIGIGLLDLFHGLNALTALIALALIVAGIFNIWGGLRSS
jgi:uncharacterized membrane protein HdeD (DUF308 family)